MNLDSYSLIQFTVHELPTGVKDFPLYSVAIINQIFENEN